MTAVWATHQDSSTLHRTRSHLFRLTPSHQSRRRGRGKRALPARTERRTLRRAVPLSRVIRLENSRRPSMQHSTSPQRRGPAWQNASLSRRAKSRSGSRIGAQNAGGLHGRRVDRLASSSLLCPPSLPLTVHVCIYVMHLEANPCPHSVVTCLCNCVDVYYHISFTPTIFSCAL